VALRAVVFDVGETLVDETRNWEHVADVCGVPRLTFMTLVAYVGDLVHNDVVPAPAAGMVAVHVRRGPWGYLQTPPREAIPVRSLTELPEAVVGV
jgi:FMN phosphatase YigB (HAD superfamily)